MDSYIPPVPRMPQRFSISSFALRSNDPPTPPVIRAIERPFELGNIQPPDRTSVHEHPNRHRRVPYVAPRAEPEPHHVPALGLGGAIVAVNDHPHRANGRGAQPNYRRRYLHNHIAVNDEQPGMLGRFANGARRLYTTTLARFVANDDFMNEPMAFQFDVFGGAQPLGHHAGVALQDALFRRRHEHPPEVEYKTEFTHPGQPESGFTFSFALPEASAPSKPPPVIIDLEASDSEDAFVAGSSKQPASPTTSVKTLLVCARCLDPLVLGGGLVGDEGRRRKVWALRCGHMIDGKCLDPISAPNENGVDEASTVTGKGKGKAREDEYTDGAAEVFASAENTVRSRLRSRVPPPPVPTMALPSPSTSSPTTLGKRKRTGKPRVEATHEWKCPVASCGEVHASVKINGAWIPEPAKGPSGKGKGKRVAMEPYTPGRGAIAVFV
ncbi:hypothetical protein C0991_002819 [Blastosporella zonata]|nr:hypothetical protein C0991_002819 [Blastosporella zonata]